MNDIFKSGDRSNLALFEALRFVTVKAEPSDFCVTEALPLPAEGASDGENIFSYFRLRKSGWTTFEAVSILSDHLNVPSRYITYCGLKDEDGITDQMVAIKGKCDPNQISNFNEARAYEERFIKLIPYGMFSSSPNIAGLSGNAFRIKARGVPRPLGVALQEWGAGQQFQFINYYDKQRFGVPGGPYTTHLMGRALLDRDFEYAFELLKASNTPEAKKAAAYLHGSKRFFEELDPRVPAFYMSAASSFEWNKETTRVASTFPGSTFTEVIEDGISKGYATSPTGIRSAFQQTATIPYKRYGKEGRPYDFTLAHRPTLIETAITIHSVAEVEEQQIVDLSFFLPAGTYATNLVTQFLLSLVETK